MYIYIYIYVLYLDSNIILYKYTYIIIYMYITYSYTKSNILTHLDTRWELKSNVRKHSPTGWRYLAWFRYPEVLPDPGWSIKSCCMHAVNVYQWLWMQCTSWKHKMFAKEQSPCDEVVLSKVVTLSFQWYHIHSYPVSITFCNLDLANLWIAVRVTSSSALPGPCCRGLMPFLSESPHGITQTCSMFQGTGD